MFVPTAKVLADSVSETGHRLTTMEVTGHRFILAEFNTHRAFSRNSASSRAIPYAKMREKALSQLAYPVKWPAEQKGMQGGEPLGEGLEAESKQVWQLAALSAVDSADQLHSIGVHKSVINRLLEPFLPHTIIVSATDWQGFWAQRCHKDAQPEIRALAEAMRQAHINSTPVESEVGEWHLPLIQHDEWADALYRDGFDVAIELFKKVSVARCARVSYLTHDGKRDIEKDIELYDRLFSHTPAHASPFEHVATPSSGHGDVASSNFRGWDQLRHILELG